jgi:hypothetical protein
MRAGRTTEIPHWFFEGVFQRIGERPLQAADFIGDVSTEKIHRQLTRSGENQCILRQKLG